MPNAGLIEPTAQTSQSARKLTPIEEAQARLVTRMAGVTFHRVFGEATPDDADALLNDLLVAAGWFDEFIEAYGRYCKSELPDVALRDFEKQVVGALEGNATYQIEQARDKLIETRDEEFADAAGWSKARNLGVD